MAEINDFSDLFDMEELNTFDKLDDYLSPTPNLSPPKPTGIASGSPPAAKNANFLVKLYMALQEEPPLTAIYWSADGRQLVVASPALLEKDILPKYWKHNKFASFGRQLNIYGFSRVYPGHKFKDENGNIRDDASVWSHPTLHRESTLDDIMTIKRRAAPKLFRTRKLANGQVVQIRAGAPVDAKLNSLRAEKQDRFGRKASDPYHLSPYPHTPTFYHSSDTRWAQDFTEFSAPQWALGSYASPAMDPAHLPMTHVYPQQYVERVDTGNRYVSDTVMASLQGNAAHDIDHSGGIHVGSNKPISPIDILQSIPDAQNAPSGNVWSMNGETRPAMHPHEFQQAIQTQGMPALSWTTPSSPTGFFPFRDRWNNSGAQAMHGPGGVFRHDLGAHRGTFCTAPASPMHVTQQIPEQEQANNSVGYPMTPRDVKITPADFQLNAKPSADTVASPFDQIYLFSQQQHTVPFSAVAETSQPLYEHIDVPVPATADAYLGGGAGDHFDGTEDGHFSQDIWPVNVMNTMTTRPLPMATDSLEVVGTGEVPLTLPYAATYRYTVPSEPAGIL